MTENSSQNGNSSPLWYRIWLISAFLAFLFHVISLIGSVIGWWEFTPLAMYALSYFLLSFLILRLIMKRTGL